MKKNVRKIIFWISLVTFCVSFMALINILFIQPMINNKKNDEIRLLYNGADNPNETDKFRALLEINGDIKGWIKINNTRVNYPVLKSSEDDPEYYLYRNYKKESTKYGSIFIDSNSKEGTDSKNIIIHGHHMNDGSMFSDILKYKNIDFYKSTPTFTFDTIYENAEWKVFSVFSTNTLEQHGPIFNYLRGSFKDEEDFMSFVKEIKDRSLINTSVDVKADDRLVTLSTCSYEFKDFRTVVVARKVRDGESQFVNVEEAVMNPNPVLPQCYYK